MPAPCQIVIEGLQANPPYVFGDQPTQATVVARSSDHCTRLRVTVRAAGPRLSRYHRPGDRRRLFQRRHGDRYDPRPCHNYLSGASGRSPVRRSALGRGHMRARRELHSERVVPDRLQAGSRRWRDAGRGTARRGRRRRRRPVVATDPVHVHGRPARPWACWSRWR